MCVCWRVLCALLLFINQLNFMGLIHVTSAYSINMGKITFIDDGNNVYCSETANKCVQFSRSIRISSVGSSNLPNKSLSHRTQPIITIDGMSITCLYATQNKSSHHKNAFSLIEKNNSHSIEFNLLKSIVFYFQMDWLMFRHFYTNILNILSVAEQK